MDTSATGTSIFELVLAVLAAVGGGGVVIVALGAWLGRIWAERIAMAQKLTGEIDLDLRSRRIEVYGDLWAATALLPKWPRDDTVTYEDLRALSDRLRQWYYRQGGMYLSRGTHDAGYGPLQGVIAKAVAGGATGALSPGDYEAVRQKCSALRSMLANDIQTRRDSPI